MRNISRFARGAALATGLALVLVGCGQAPEAPNESAAPSADAPEGFATCIVSDDGGFSDRSFNQSSAEGIRAASEALGIKAIEVESQKESEYAPNLTNVIEGGCTMVVPVGFKLSAATKAAAAANPDVKFAIVDDNQFKAENVKSLIFDAAPAAFLAGYAAASYSKTGKVATWGGVQIPTVTIFMDGFYDGVMYYNEQKGTDVKVVGWEREAQTGLFTGGFAKGAAAKSTAEQALAQGADVVMPVGGPIFESAIEAIRDRGPDAGIALVGVDADLYNSAPDGKDLYLTSVLKGMAIGVETAVLEASKGEFSNEPYVGTLENEGVGIAPFHEFEDKVDPGLAGELDELKQKIIDGEVVVESPASP